MTDYIDCENFAGQRGLADMVVTRESLDVASIVLFRRHAGTSLVEHAADRTLFMGAPDSLPQQIGHGEHG